MKSIKRVFALGVAGAILGGAVAGCNTGYSTGTLPPPPPASAMTTAQILAQARAPSETSEPYAVNAGAVMLIDTSDTTESMDINGP